jgi:hypothetical protein
MEHATQQGLREPLIFGQHAQRRRHLIGSGHDLMSVDGQLIEQSAKTVGVCGVGICCPRDLLTQTVLLVAVLHFLGFSDYFKINISVTCFHVAHMFVTWGWAA